jgi:hypothetical protein
MKILPTQSTTHVALQKVIDGFNSKDFSAIVEGEFLALVSGGIIKKETAERLKKEACHVH